MGLRVTSGRSQHRLLPPDGDLISAEESLEELAALAATAGARVAQTSIQTRPRIDPATLVGSGKVDELKAQIQFHEATTLIVDRELSPTQQRNLEKALDVKVLDRTQLILDIFARRARTREGQLQVELARKARTKVVGKLRMKPTVSLTNARLLEGKTICLTVGSSVANIFESASTPAPVSRLKSVDFPAFV